MTDTLRQECKELLLAINELGESEWNAAYEMDCDDLLAFARVQQAKGLREAAGQIMTVHTAHHSGDYCQGYLARAKESKAWCEAQATAREEGRDVWQR